MTFGETRLEGMNKRGAGWTVWKLINIILLVLVLVVLFFAVGGSLPKLVEKVGDFANSVLIDLHLKGGDFQLSGCAQRNIAGYGDGQEFLSFFKNSKIEFYVCDKACVINKSSVGDFKMDSNGKFFVWDKDIKKWVEVRNVNKISQDDILAREIYEKTLRETDYPRNLISKGFLLIGLEPNLIFGVHDHIVAEWIDGVWEVYNVGNNGGLIYLGTEDEKAIDFFIKNVFGSDMVYYKQFEKPVKDWGLYNIYKLSRLVEKGEVENIDKIVGDCGRDNKIDCKGEIGKLKEYFYGFKKGGNVKSKNLKELKITINHKEYVGQVYSLNLMSSDNLIFILKNLKGNNKYGVMINSFAPRSAVVHRPPSFKEEVLLLDGKPLIVVEFKDGKWVPLGKKEHYALSEEDFQEQLKISKIYEFMKRHC